MSSLLDAQDEYLKKGLSRFHTPGHAGKAPVLSRFAALLPYDVTEVENFDSLYHADGVLAECERAAAKLFGAKRSLISAGGCTLAIQTMMALAVPQGGRIAIGRNAHRTAVNTLALLDIDPVWLYPEPRVVTPDTVAQTLRKTKVDAVYLTSPDYYGRMCDIEAIAALCHEQGIPLLVDNAHGSHLKFLLPDRHPLSLGADMTACSLHKTLPVLTGGALLNIANERYIPDAKAKMELFGSTSPSYLILASMDACFDWLAQSGQEAFTMLAQRARLLKAYARQRGFYLPEGQSDPVRFTLDLRRSRIDGQTAHDVFLECGAVCEYFDRGAIVFILTPFHDARDFSTLYRGLNRLKDRRPPVYLDVPDVFRPPETCMSVRQAVFSAQELVQTAAACGRTAAEAVCPCPPGIPVVIPGEKIDEAAVSLLKCSGISAVKVVK